jgi:PAS domain S-box-containing protein
MNDKEQIISEIVEKGVFEAIGDGVSIQDTNFKILYQNNSHKKIIGNHVGEYCYNAYEKNEKVCTGCPLADTFKDGEIHTRERSAPTDKGTIYVEITSSPIKVPSGEIIAGIEVVRDITERKQIAEALRTSEKKFRNLAESLSELVYRADPDTFVTKYVNKSIEEIYGYTVEEWLNKPELWDKSIHPDDKERVFAKIKEAQNKYEPFVIEYRIIRKDAGIRWVKDHISWEKDNDGNVISLNGIMYDITERKKTENALKKSENELNSMYNAITDFLTIISPDYRILRVNRVVEKQYGKDLVGKICYEVYQARNEICPDCPTKKAVETKKPAFSFQPATEVSPPVYIDAFPMLDDKGEVIAIVEHGKDVTERIKAEEEINNRVVELEEFFNMSVNRELKMKKLKEEIEKQKSELLKHKK